MLQTILPDSLARLNDTDVDQRIRDAREKLGRRLVVLGHHYQRDEVIKFADFRGDSFKLAQWASTRKDAEYIVFCGVHFMAESADILSASYQKVVLPDMSAGCSMADMAALDQVETCWDDLSSVTTGKIIPITYMNSTASIKAFCGRHGGAVCTSSNATAVMRWALERGDRILFLPDQHLGRNTGYALGLRLEEMPVWDPYEELGGNTKEEVDASIADMIARTARIVEGMRQATMQARAGMPGIAASAGATAITPGLDTGTQQLSADDIKGMSMKEFAALRQKVGMGNGGGQGIFG